MMMAIRKQGMAEWSGGLKDGKGTVSLQSGALKQQPYGFNTRFEDKPGTNPEELIGAAHAACFTMALSGALEKAGLKADSLKTTATVSLDKSGEGFAISGIELVLNGVVPGADEARFTEIAEEAKVNCPVSKALSAVPITLKTTFG
jgi:lipoyl-dependent peroxiredoxin